MLPDLTFTMAQAGDGRSVTEAEDRGRVVAPFLGFTSCPDVCPLTLSNLSVVADNLGALAEALSVAFVTKDSGRDTPQALVA